MVKIKVLNKGNTVGKYRVFKGMTQMEVSELAEISVSTLRHIEKHHFKTTSLELATNLSQIFGVNLSYLFPSVKSK